MTDERRDADLDILDELRAELAAVEPSPEFAARVRQRIAGELDLLREELLAVDPSPDFAARVRQRLDAEPAPARLRWLDWRWLAPVAAAAVVLIAAIVTLQRTESQPSVNVADVAQVTPVSPSSAANPSPAPRASVIPARSPVPSAPRALPSDPEPVLEVITNQPALLAALWAQATPPVAIVDAHELGRPVEVNEVIIAPVEVDPVVVKWLAEPRPAIPLPVIRRVATEPVERRTK